MDTLDGILGDWQACGAVGVLLPAFRIEAVIERISWRVRTVSASGSAADALELLVGPFVHLLRIAPGGEGCQEVVHFVRFWKASQEVWRRACQDERLEDDDFLVAEVAAFRDALLRRFDSGGVTMAWFLEQVQATRQMSVDADAWGLLEVVVAEACSAASAVECKGFEPCAADAEACAADAEADVEANLRLDEVSMLLLAWLLVLVEDSCRGLRSAKVKCVCDVAGCGPSAAARQLGVAGWDVEEAMRGLLGGALDAAGCAWSSQGAKLRLREVQCPVCAVPYAEGAKALVTQCCFQALCLDCRAAIEEQEVAFKCPFCRKTEALTPERYGLALALAAERRRAASQDGSPNFWRRQQSGGAPRVALPLAAGGLVIETWRAECLS